MVGYRRQRLKREHAGHPGMSNTVHVCIHICTIPGKSPLTRIDGSGSPKNMERLYRERTNGLGTPSLSGPNP